MKRLALALGVLLCACQSNKEISQNLLDKTTDSEGTYYSQRMAEDTKQFLIRSTKSKLKYTDVRVYPHELPTGELFLGGWIRIATLENQKSKPVNLPYTPNSLIRPTKK